MRRPVRITTHHEAHHLATDIAAPPPALQRPIGPAEGVDHCGHFRVGFAEKVEHALRGQVASHLLPHDVAQFHLRDVQPDAQRHWEIHQVEPVGDDEHAVDGDLDADDVVVVRWRPGHACPTRICLRKALLIASSIWSYRFAASESLPQRSSEIAAIVVPTVRRAASTAASAPAEAEAMLPCVVRTAAAAPSARTVADRIPTAARPCSTASSPRWAVVTRKSTPDMLVFFLLASSWWHPGRRPGWIVRNQPSCDGPLQGGRSGIGYG